MPAVILTGKGPPVQPIQPNPKFSVKVLNAEKLQILQFVEETLFEDPTEFSTELL